MLSSSLKVSGERGERSHVHEGLREDLVREGCGDNKPLRISEIEIGKGQKGKSHSEWKDGKHEL